MFSPPLSSPDTLHPLDWYAHLRATEPVSRPHGRGPWQVVCYDDVKRVLSDHAAFSSSGGAGEPTSPLGASLVSTDPPRHRHLRALVTQAFTPTAVAALAPASAPLWTTCSTPSSPPGGWTRSTTWPIHCPSS